MATERIYPPDLDTDFYRRTLEEQRLRVSPSNNKRHLEKTVLIGAAAGFGLAVARLVPFDAFAQPPTVEASVLEGEVVSASPENEASLSWQVERIVESPGSLTVVSPPLVLANNNIGFLVRQQLPEVEKQTVDFHLRENNGEYRQPQEIVSLLPDWYLSGTSAVTKRGRIIAVFGIGRLTEKKRLAGQSSYQFALELFTGASPLAQAEEERILWRQEAYLGSDENTALLSPKLFVDSQEKTHLIYLELKFAQEQWALIDQEERMKIWQNIIELWGAPEQPQDFEADLKNLERRDRLLQEITESKLVESLRIRHLLLPEALEDSSSTPSSIPVKTRDSIDDFQLTEIDGVASLLVQKASSEGEGVKRTISLVPLVGEEKWGKEVPLNIPDPSHFDVDKDHIAVEHNGLYDPSVSVYRMGAGGTLSPKGRIQRAYHSGKAKIAVVDPEQVFVFTTEHVPGTDFRTSEVNRYQRQKEEWLGKRVGWSYASSLEVTVGKWANQTGTPPAQPLNVVWSAIDPWNRVGTRQAVFFAYPLEIR